MNTDKNYDTTPEIDLIEIIGVLFKKKILILSLTFSATALAVIYSLSLPNIYTSKTLLSPTSTENSISNKLGNYSAIAGIAGINLPSNSNSKTSEAIERIKSFDFFENQFLPHINLEDLVAAVNWNQSENAIKYDKKIFNNQDNKWVKEVNSSRLLKPSNQEAFEEYEKILLISEDKNTSFISMEIKHVSPYISQKWSQLIIQRINSHMRDLDKIEAINSIDFLNSSAQKAQLSGLKDVISNLLETQMRILTLAEASEYYIFKIISSPLAPEKKSGPSRAIICIIGVFFGLFIGIVISLTAHYVGSRKMEPGL